MVFIFLHKKLRKNETFIAFGFTIYGCLNYKFRLVEKTFAILYNDEKGYGLPYAEKAVSSSHASPVLSKSRFFVVPCRSASRAEARKGGNDSGAFKNHSNCQAFRRFFGCLYFCDTDSLLFRYKRGTDPMMDLKPLLKLRTEPKPQRRAISVISLSVFKRRSQA